MALFNDDGHAVRIVNCEHGKTLSLDTAALTSVLKKVYNMPVAVLSIAGEYRTGKSFLLNFLIRFLEASERGRRSEWLKDSNMPLTGFDWAPGAQRMTVGILLWSKPYIITTEDGTKVAVLLMDTQGLFDDKTAPEDAATLFALSTMISSTQVYNVMRTIGEHHLKHLELFVEAAKMVLEETCKDIDKPFQRLIYLVRDWTDPSLHRFGEEGGLAYLLNKLMAQGNQPQALRNVRENIHSCFESFECFLMPTPGTEACETPDPDDKDDVFTGCISGIKPKFVKKLDELAPFLLDSERVVIKKYGTKALTGIDLRDNIVRYMTLFQSGKLPKPVSTKEALITEYNTILISDVMEKFRFSVQKVGDLTSHVVIVNPDGYLLKLNEAETKVKAFFAEKVRGNKHDVKAFQKKLDDSITSIKDMQKLELKKNILEKQKQDEKECRKRLVDSRNAYEVKMRKHIDAGETEPQILHNFHTKYREDIVSSFKKSLKDRVLDTKELLDELNGGLEQTYSRLIQNAHTAKIEKDLKNAVIANASSQASSHYKFCMEMISAPGMKHVDLKELEEKHKQGKNAACEVYDGICLKEGISDMNHRKRFLQEVDKLWDRYQKVNEENKRILMKQEQKCNEVAAQQKKHYVTRMEAETKKGPRNQNDFQSLHESVSRSAIFTYKEATYKYGDVHTEWLVKLQKELDEEFVAFNDTNTLALTREEREKAKIEGIKSDILKQLQNTFDELYDTPYDPRDQKGKLEIRHPDFLYLPDTVKSELKKILDEKQEICSRHEKEKKWAYDTGLSVCVTEATNNAVRRYRETMSEDIDIGKSYKTTDELEEMHNHTFENVCDTFFKETEKFRVNKEEHKQSLKKSMDYEYRHFVKMNELNKQQPQTAETARQTAETLSENREQQEVDVYGLAKSATHIAAFTLAPPVLKPVVPAIVETVFAIFGK